MRIDQHEKRDDSQWTGIINDYSGMILVDLAGMSMGMGEGDRPIIKFVSPSIHELSFASLDELQRRLFTLICFSIHHIPYASRLHD
jgi:hypothetical protein